MNWSINELVVWQESGAEVQLYNSATGEFLTLNASAAAIWRHLANLGEQRLIANALAEDFGALDDSQRRQISADTEEFFLILAEKGIIVAAAESVA